MSPEDPGGTDARRATGHRERVLRRRGPTPEEAGRAVILVHGRGGSARGMLELAAAVAPPGTAMLAPRADGRSWYPNSFLAQLERNEPWLSSALQWLEEIVTGLADDGVPASRVALVGFSQGACLSLEYAARHTRRYGGVAGLSGGLIGPPGRSWPFEGSLERTPVFLGCSDRDPHIPEERVHETARVLSELGAEVTTEIYPGLGHTVNEDETDRVRAMIEGLGEAGG